AGYGANSVRLDLVWLSGPSSRASLRARQREPTELDDNAEHLSAKRSGRPDDAELLGAIQPSAPRTKSSPTRPAGDKGSAQTHAATPTATATAADAPAGSHADPWQIGRHESLDVVYHLGVVHKAARRVVRVHVVRSEEVAYGADDRGLAVR